MILVTGGAYQGKMDFAKSLCKTENPIVAKGDSVSKEKLAEAEIVADFHLYIKQLLKEACDPYEEIKNLLDQNPKIIIEVTELGCGIVPMDEKDRYWREITGRICCFLAKEAEAVYRMYCGISTRIK